MSLKTVAVAIAFLVIAGRAADAQYLRFIKGDAYFQGEITEVFLKEIEKGEEQTTVSMEWGGRYNKRDVLGNVRIDIETCPREFRSGLTAVYRKIRSFRKSVFEISERDGVEVREEQNGPLCLIYNADYDIYRYRVGLRFNEDWAENASAYGLPIDFIPFYEYSRRDVPKYVPSYVLFDWKYSKSVDGLRVTMSKERPNTDRVRIQAQKVMCIIVVDENQLDEERQADGIALMYSVTCEGAFTINLDREKGEVSKKKL